MLSESNQALRLLARQASLRSTVSTVKKPSLLIRCSTRPGVMGKLPADQTHRLGKGWTNIELEIEDLFKLLSTDGYPLGPSLIEEGNSNGTRESKTFASHQVVLVDIDEGLRVEEVLVDEFYRSYAAGYYITPTYSEKLHKFRIIFILEEPITNADEMRNLYIGLIRIFGGDEACIDASRLFYGTKNAARKEFNIAKRLPTDIVSFIIDEAKQKEEQQFQHVTQQNYEPPDDIEKREMIEKLKQIFLGDHTLWFRVGAGMKHSGYSLQDFIEVSVGHLMREKSQNDCKRMWNDIKSTSKPITFGSLVYMVRERLGQDAWKGNKNG